MTRGNPPKRGGQPRARALCFSAGAGFTLIEMTVVLVIVSILTAVGLISYASLRSNQEARSAGQKITATLAAARQMAITTNGRFQVFFSLATGEFWIDELDTTGGVLRRQVLNPGQLPEFMGLESIQIEGAPATGDFAAIRYWPDGHSDNAALYLVRMTDDPVLDENITTIKVFGPTGAAQTFEGQRR